MAANDTNSLGVAAVADDILRYLRVRPQAADTMEGIHQWWVDWSKHEQSPETTELALNLLHARGEMEPVEIGDRRIWRACRRADLDKM
jgi:hypothetical protein